MKMFQCDRCGRIFYPENDNHTLYGNKNDVCFDLCCNCMSDFKSWLNMSQKEKNDSLNDLDKFYDQLKRIKSIVPEFRIGQIIQVLNSTISSDCDSFYIEDKDYVNAAESYADRLEHRRSY